VLKSSGVVRKIDDLGRIVIPKEIRKYLGIREGENIEIAVEDSNIKLTKKNIINNYLEDINNICEVASSLVSGTIIITDRDKVTYVSDSFTLNVGDNLSLELTNIMDNRLYTEEDILKKFIFNKKELVGYFSIYPIIDEGNAIGLVIIYDKNNSVRNYHLLTHFIANYISRKIDIS